MPDDLVAAPRRCHLAVSTAPIAQLGVLGVVMTLRVEGAVVIVQRVVISPIISQLQVASTRLHAKNRRISSKAGGMPSTHAVRELELDPARIVAFIGDLRETTRV